MIINEKLLDTIFDGGEILNTAARIATYVVSILGVLGLGWWTTRRQVAQSTEAQSA
jgi:hypothetical protein